MTEPTWLRAAALTAALAGLRAGDATRGWPPEHARAIERVLTELASPNRSARARALVAARVRLTRTADEGTSPRVLAAVGARIITTVVAALGEDERAQMLRMFDADSLRLAARAAGDVVAIARSEILAFCRLVVQSLGRMPTAIEWGALAIAPSRFAPDPWQGDEILRRARVRGIRFEQAFETADRLPTEDS